MKLFEKLNMSLIVWLVAFLLIGVFTGYQAGKYLAMNDIERSTPESVIEEPELIPLNINGFHCWLDANPEFDYTGNQNNVVIGVTCPIDMMFSFMPAAEPINE